MPATPDDELASAAAAVQAMDSLDRRLEVARRQAEASAGKAAAARVRVAAEARDVERLQSLSLTKMLSHLKRSHDKDLARETAEHQAAEYEYLTLHARADADGRIVEDLQRRRVGLGDVKNRYEQALSAKERWLPQHCDPAAVRLRENAEARGLLTAELAEIGQAREAAEHAAEHMREVAEFLVSARSWSAYDTWWGGGFVTSWMKRNNLDTVAEEIRAADAVLKPFTAELSDVYTEVLQLVEAGPLTSISMCGSTIRSPI